MTAIKIRPKDIKRLDYAIRAFNAKITREEKKNASAFEYLPQRVERSELWAMIATRKDYNRILKSLQRATKNKKAFDPIETKSGLRLTRWEKQEFNYNLRRVNNLKEKEVSKLEDFQKLNLSNDFTRDYASDMIDKMAGEKIGGYYSYDIDNMTTKEWQLARQFTSEASQDMYNLYNYTKYKNEYIKRLYDVFERWTDLQTEVNQLASWLQTQDVQFVYFAQLKYPQLALEWLYEMGKMQEKLQQLQYYWYWAGEDWKEVSR